MTPRPWSTQPITGAQHDAWMAAERHWCGHDIHMREGFSWAQVLRGEPLPLEAFSDGSDCPDRGKFLISD